MIRVLANCAWVIGGLQLLAGYGAAQLNAPGKASASDVIEPSVLATIIGDARASKPVIIQVGFPTLFKSNRIPGSSHAGPGTTPAGLEALKETLAKVPKDREIVIYCGCCPWDKCPNIRPALDLLRKLGYTRVKALMIENNLDDNWIKKGYPVQKGS